MINYYSKYHPKVVVPWLLNKLAAPFKAANVQLSVIASADDDKGRPNQRLLHIAAKAVAGTLDIDLSAIAAREKKEHSYIQVFPGEHYTLLAALVRELKPKIAVEIGTHLGQASLVIKSFLPAGGTLHTFDVVPWNQFDYTCFIPSDFTDGQLQQHPDDLTDFSNVLKHKAMLENADFIFIDALKDGVQEKKFLANFEKIQLKKDCILMFDDIRVWNMLKIWRNIDKPKIDLTSFGHWSGTGLVDWHG